MVIKLMEATKGQHCNNCGENEGTKCKGCNCTTAKMYEIKLEFGLLYICTKHILELKKKIKGVYPLWR